jgi:hypothetical protein
MNANFTIKTVSILSFWIFSACLMLQTNSVLAQQDIVQNGKAPSQLLIESIRVLGGFRSPVVRWNRVVKLAIVGDRSTTTMRKITSIFNKISLMTGIRYKQIDHALSIPERYLEAIDGSPHPHLRLCGRSASTNCANFVVLVVSQELMHNIALSLPLKPIYQKATARKNKIHCFFSPTVTSNFEITHSLVWVRNDLEEFMLNTCLQEEIYQSFGLFNDYSNSHFYSFNNIVAPKKITSFDKQLMASLYDAAFPLGASILPIAQQLTDYCKANCPDSGDVSNSR